MQHRRVALKTAAAAAAVASALRSTQTCGLRHRLTRAAQPTGRNNSSVIGDTGLMESFPFCPALCVSLKNLSRRLECTARGLLSTAERRLPNLMWAPDAFKELFGLSRGRNWSFETLGFCLVETFFGFLRLRLSNVHRDL